MGVTLGERNNASKQELLFDMEDYKAVVNYHANLSNHHRTMAKGYADRCEQKHKVQLSLWDLDEKNKGGDYDEWLDAPSDVPNKPR